MYAKQPLDILPPPDDDLRGAWLNRETVLGEDFSAAGDDLTVMNPADVRFEDVGATFGGTNGYLRRAEANWNSGDSQGTILAWVKPSALNLRSIFASTDEPGAIRYFRFYINTHLYVGQRNVDAQDFCRSTAAVVADEWQRVGLVSTGTEYLFYINGQNTPTIVAVTANTGDWLAETPNRDGITIGTEVISAAASSFFAGQIKDVQYHSRPLSAAEIAADYALGVPDDDLRLWLPGEEDYSRFVRTLTFSGGVVRGMWTEYDGTDDKVDCGDLGNIQQFSTIIEPTSTSEQVVQLDTNKHITIAAGTVTYTGLTAVDTFVDGVRSTTLAAGRRQFLVCQFSEVDANNFELGWDGTNYGQIKLRQTKARAGLWTAKRVGEIDVEQRRFM